MALYYTRVWNKVRSNWTLPDEWRTGKLEAVVVLTVLADGRIADMRFEKKIGPRPVRSVGPAGGGAIRPAAQAAGQPKQSQRRDRNQIPNRRVDAQKQADNSSRRFVFDSN